MPGHVRNKNIQLDNDYYEDDDFYDDEYDDGYYDEPVSQPRPAAQANTAQKKQSKDHFDGLHWGQLPPDRMSKIREYPRAPPGRLLGGSGKPSKLQALAAQRRKQQEETRSQSSSSSQRQDQEAEVETSSLAILDKLDKRLDAQNHDTALEENSIRSRAERIPRYKRQKTEQEQEQPDEPDPVQPGTEARGTSTPAEHYDLRAPPSMFASALIGRSEVTSNLHKAQELRLVVTADSNPFIGPSPDDVVSKAQSKGGPPPPKRPPPNKASTNGVTQGVASLKIAEAPTIRSKNVDVPAEYERPKSRGSANFVVIGHVDHGKSTLMGRLLLDLKHPNLSQRDFEKLQRASSAAGKGSFALAWAMDARSDEREHGVTVDIATQHFQTDKTDFTILDAPGHQDFVKNMIAGTSQADFAVLVVDASTDAFEAGLRGQTREHAMLARSIGIARLVVAVNKMDAAKWSKDRFDEIVAQLQGFFSAAGFSQKNISFVPCAGLTGDNVATPLTSERQKLASWYNGPTLVQALEASEPRERRIRDPLRMTISEVFNNTVSGAPTGDVSVTGLIDSGNLQIGTRILAQPSSLSCSVKGIEVSKTPRDWAVAGQIATLHLVGIQEEHLQVGDVLCEKGNKELQNVRKFTAKCLTFEHLLPTQLALHRGQIYSSVKIQFLELVQKEDSAITNRNGATKKKKRAPRVVHPQQIVRMLAELYDNDRGLPLDLNDRVVFREGGKTVATGMIDGIEEYVKQ